MNAVVLFILRSKHGRRILYITCQKQNGTAEKALYQTKQIDRYMQNHTALTEFDEEAMRTIVKKIVVSNEAFVFELPNGLHLKEKR